MFVFYAIISLKPAAYDNILALPIGDFSDRVKGELHVGPLGACIFGGDKREAVKISLISRYSQPKRR